MSKSKRIKFHKLPYPVPRWVQRYVIKVHRLLVPEWTLIVRWGTPSDDSDVIGIVNPNSEYLDADIVFNSKIRDNTDGRVAVIHELLHLVMDRLETSVELIAATADKRNFKNGKKFSPSIMALLNNHDNAEEETIVRLSRVLEQLI